MKNNKVLVTTSTFPRWRGDSGSPFVFELSKQLINHGLEVVILAPHSRNAKKFEIVDGLKVYRYQYLPCALETLPYDGGILSKLRKNKLYYLQIPFFLLFQLFAIRRIVKKEEIDIIHAHWIIPQGFVAALYKKLFNRKIKIVTTAHGSDLLGLKNILTKPLKKFVLMNTNTLTAVSKHLEHEAIKLYNKTPIEVLPMGVDFQKFSPQRTSSEIRTKFDAQGRLLLFVGRLAKEKGILLLLDSMPEIIRQFPDIKLLIIGTGRLEYEIQNFIQKEKLENNIFPLGFIDHSELPCYLASADILIGPSLYEGLGLIFVEALACGCAVIASDLPSISDFILNGKTGLKVRLNDREDLTNKVVQLLNDDQLLQKIKQGSRDSALSAYDIVEVSQKYSKLLTQ